MVTIGEAGKEGGEKAMAMGPERSKLHNFTLPPCLKWGNPRLLRCRKENRNGEISAAATERRSSSGVIGLRRESEPEWIGSASRTESLEKSPSPAVAVGGSRWRSSGGDDDGDGGIKAVREKVMLDIRTAADEMKFRILKEGLEEIPPAPAAAAPAPAPAVQTDVDSLRPWNLRTRRAACKAPNGTSSVSGCGGNVSDGGKRLKVDEPKPSFSSLGTDIRSANGEKKEMAKFSVSLSRREIEEDFMAMVGHRPPRRPKKRPKIVQKELDSLFPGLWLTEVTADTYKVHDAAEHGKR